MINHTRKYYQRENKHRTLSQKTIKLNKKDINSDPLGKKKEGVGHFIFEYWNGIDTWKV